MSRCQPAWSVPPTPQRALIVEQSVRSLGSATPGGMIIRSAMQHINSVYNRTAWIMLTELCSVFILHSTMF